MVIYKTTNLINGKEYIGLDTKNRPEYKYLGSGMALKKAVKKYGKVNFKKRTLCVCENIDDLNKAEIEYISLYNTFYGRGYNLCEGGRGIVGITKVISEKQRQRQSIFMRGNKHGLGVPCSEERKRKIGDANRGRPCPEHQKNKLSKLWKGTKRSKEDCKKISKGQLGRKQLESVKKKVGDFHRRSLVQKYGEKKAIEMKKKMSASRKGISPPNKGKPRPFNQRRLYSILTYKRLIDNYLNIIYYYFEGYSSKDIQTITNLSKFCLKQIIDKLYLPSIRNRKKFFKDKWYMSFWMAISLPRFFNGAKYDKF